MSYLIEEFAYYGKLPFTEEMDGNFLKLSSRDTVSVLATRKGAAIPNVLPKRTADEVIDKPLEQVDFPKHVVSIASETVKKCAFAPEYLTNLRKANFSSSGIELETNLTNFGSVASLRKLVLDNRYSAKEIYSTTNQIAAVGVCELVISEKNQSIYLGRRGKTEVGSTWAGYPAGNVGGGSTIYQTIRDEEKEEIQKRTGSWENGRYLLGMGRGLAQSISPALYFLVETDLSFKNLWKGTNQVNPMLGSVEHDLIQAIPLDERAYTEWMKENLIGTRPNGQIYQKILDNSLINFVQAGKAYFGNKFDNDFRKEIASTPYDVQIIQRNPFGSTHYAAS